MKYNLTYIFIFIVSVTIAQVNVTKKGFSAKDSLEYARAGDTVNWVITLDNITEEILDSLAIEDIISGDHSYVENSLILPPGFGQDSSGNITSISIDTKDFLGPGVVGGVDVNLKPRPTITSSGDGYQPHFYGDNIYFIGHHSGGDILSCYNLNTQTNCDGYPRGLPVGPSSSSRTDAVVDAVQVIDGVLYFPAYKDFTEWGLGCLDLRTNEECDHGYIKMGPDSTKTAIELPPTYRIPVAGPWKVGDELYIMDWQMQLHGYNIKTQSLVAGSPFDLSTMFSPMITRNMTSGIVGQVFEDVVYLRVSYYGSNNVLNWDGHYVTAFNATTKSIQAGWPQDQAVQAHTIGGESHDPTLFLRYNPAGKADAICTSCTTSDGSGMVYSCLDVTNGTLIPDPLPPTFPKQAGGLGTEVYLDNISYFPRWISEQCYAWDWNTNELVNTFNGPMDYHSNYGFGIDEDGCIWAGGHDNRPWSFNPVRGGSCVTIEGEGRAQPDLYYCYSEPEVEWEKLVVYNLDTNQFSSFEIVLIGDDDVTPLDTFELLDTDDIDTVIDLSIAPFVNQKALTYKVDATLNGEALIDTPQIALMFNGPPIEICLQTVIENEGACDGSITGGNAVVVKVNDEVQASDSVYADIVILPEIVCLEAGRDTTVLLCLEDKEFVDLDTLLKGDIPITPGGIWKEITNGTQSSFDAIEASLNISGTSTGTYNYYYHVESWNVTNDTLIKDTAHVTVIISEIKTEYTSQNVNCFGDCDGHIDVNVTTGIEPILYEWEHISQSVNSLTQLCAGEYSVIVKDSLGCLDSISIEITEPPVLELTEEHQNLKCFEVCEGTAGVTAKGGTSDYTYQWNNGETASSIDKLCVGIYSVEVTDANSCKDTLSLEITQPDELKAQIDSLRHPSCSGSKDGFVAVSAWGGTATFSYNWNIAQDSSTITNIGAGKYIVSITDSNGCTTTLEETLIEPDSLIATFSNDTTICKNTCAELRAFASGGTQPYEYSWNSGAYESVSTIEVCPTEAETHAVVVRDANNCTTERHQYQISIGEDVVIGQMNSDTICSGDSVVLKATANGGTPDYTFLWSPDNQTTQNIKVAPTTTTNYIVTVTDKCNLTDQTNAEIVVHPLPVVDFVADKTEGCVPLEVNFNHSIPNITSCLWDFGDGYFVSECENVSHLYDVVGVYRVSLKVVDANGCENEKTVNEMIYVWPLPNADFIPTPQLTTILNPEINCEDISTDTIIKWDWNFNNDEYISQIQHPTYAFKDSGTYNIHLKVTNNYGCTDTITKPIRIDGFFSIYVPNAFTPNNDGRNDFFPPKEIGLSADGFELMIFNRWGELIYYSTNISQPWYGLRNKGITSGVQAQQDVYVWKIKGKSIYGEKVNLLGRVTLVR